MERELPLAVHWIGRVPHWRCALDVIQQRNAAIVEVSVKDSFCGIDFIGSSQDRSLQSARAVQSRCAAHLADAKP